MHRAKKKENQNNCELNIINQNISESFTEKDPEEIWLGLMRYAYNTIVRQDKNHTKPQTLSEKLKLHIDVKEEKDSDEKDKKLQRSCIWEECKFLQTVVWLGLHLRGLHNEVPANVIDESIDEALMARKNVIQKNLKLRQLLLMFSKP